MADHVITMEPDLNLHIFVVLLTCNKYSEFLPSLAIYIHETVGLYGVWITGWWDVVLHGGLFRVCAHWMQ